MAAEFALLLRDCFDHGDQVPSAFRSSLRVSGSAFAEPAVKRRLAKTQCVFALVPAHAAVPL
jgi:hypothetical protein